MGLEEGRGVLAMVYVGGLSVGVVGQHPLAVLPIGCLRAEVVEGEGQGFWKVCKISLIQIVIREYLKISPVLRGVEGPWSCPMPGGGPTFNSLTAYAATGP